MMRNIYPSDLGPAATAEDVEEFHDLVAQLMERDHMSAAEAEDLLWCNGDYWRQAVALSLVPGCESCAGHDKISAASVQTGATWLCSECAASDARV